MGAGGRSRSARAGAARLALPSAERQRSAAVAVAALVAASLAARVPDVWGEAVSPAPTGTRLVDEAWCALFAGGLTWAGGRARRGPLVVAAAASVVLASTAPSLVLAVAALLVGAWHAVEERSSSRASSITSGLVALSLLAGSGGHHRWVATLTTTAVTALVLVSAARWSRTVRRNLRRAALAGGGALVLASGAAVVAVVLARPDIDAGTEALREARTASARGDVDAARAHFDEARDALGSGWRYLRYVGAPGRFVPGVSQQVATAERVAWATESASGALADASAAVDLDRLAVTEGSIDLTLVAELAEPISSSAAAVSRTTAFLEGLDRQLVLGPLSDLLDDALDEARQADGTARRLDDAISVIPDLLGEGEPRRYLVLFGTPVEARNRWGFPGSFAVLRFEDGQMAFEASGPIRELDPLGPLDEVGIDVPPRVAPYESYGPTQDWRSVTIPPHFPAVADIAQQVGRQSPLGEVHGVVMVGPRAAAAVVGLLGGVDLPDRGLRLTEATAERYITVDQYFEFPDAGEQGERKDLLADLAEEVADRLTEAALPGFAELRDVFAPLVASGDLVLSVPELTNDRAAALLHEAGLDGAMPDPAGDVLHLGHLNGGASKIDMHLHRSVDYEVAIDAAGRLDATLQVELTNEAPASGEPRYVIGNALDLPDGTSRSILLLHTRHRLRSLTADGAPLPAVTTADGSLFVHQAVVDIGPGETVVLQAELVGLEPLAGPYQLTLLPNGLLNQDRTRVSVTDARDGTSWSARPEVDRLLAVAPDPIP